MSQRWGWGEELHDMKLPVGQLFSNLTLKVVQTCYKLTGPF